MRVQFFGGHVTADLLAFAEGTLAEPRARVVTAHVERCERCRAELEAIRNAAGILRQELVPHEVPAARADAMREAVTSTPRRAPSLPRWAVAAACVVFAAAIGWQIGRPWIVLSNAVAAVPLEREARRLHAGLRTGTSVEFRSSSPPEIRKWLESQRAPVASLARGSEAGPFEPIGASVVWIAEQNVSLVRYAIDGEDVTLLTARAGTVGGAPGSWPLSKQIRHRLDESTGALTWTTGGQTYALVSDLPGRGLRACLMCHDDARFTRAVAALDFSVPIPRRRSQ